MIRTPIILHVIFYKVVFLENISNPTFQGRALTQLLCTSHTDSRRKLLFWIQSIFFWFRLVCSGWVLWHINYCRLFNVKSSLYIFIKYMIWFGLVGFYGISTIVGYLMSNPLYTYSSNIYNLVWLGFMAYQLL